jgi:dolichol-phosphate hexosyltransferase
MGGFDRASRGRTGSVAGPRAPLLDSPQSPPFPAPTHSSDRKDARPHMLSGLSVSVVIPCYNEEAGVREVIGRMPAGVDQILVVDNNSTDRTAEVAASLGARVVPERVRGYGAAYKAGLRSATGDVLVTMDGDGTYPPEEIPGLVGHLVTGGLDFLSTSRFPLADPRAMGVTNRIGNGVLTLVCGLLFGRRLRDSQSGMWVFRRTALERVRPTSDGMAFSQEIKLEALRRGLRFDEVHIPYGVRSGEVKLQRWRDGWNNLTFLFRKRCERS